VSVRIAIITESFPPDVNGVAHSVLRIAGQLMLRGHQPLVIAPEPVSPWPPADAALGYPVVRVPSVPMPGYPGFRLGLSARRVRAALARHRAELVHLASPFVLGASGCSAARQLGLPVVAVYQTDVPAYARLYGTGLVGQALSWQRLRRIHHRAARTLAPSTAAAADLQAHGIGRVWLWGRGVDTSRFAPARRDGALRQSLAPGGEMLAGYVGRLAPEKRVDLLAGVAALPGVRLVMVGSGPAEAAARRAMPAAVFLGQRQGDALPDPAGSRGLRPAGRRPGGGRPDRPGRRRRDRVPGSARRRRRAGRRRRAAGRRSRSARGAGRGRAGESARPGLARSV
jgi:phosphatidylinositol alpha 1,6-mannosyltransferase